MDRGKQSCPPDLRCPRNGRAVGQGRSIMSRHPCRSARTCGQLPGRCRACLRRLSLSSLMIHAATGSGHAASCPSMGASVSSGPGRRSSGPAVSPDTGQHPQMPGTLKRLASGPCRLRHGHFVACHRAGMPVVCVLSRHLVRRASPHADRIPRMSLAVSHSGSAGSKLPARLAPAVLANADRKSVV